jgi:peroxiredoxin
MTTRKENNKKTKRKGFNVYSVSLEDMMDVWIESFHVIDNVLVIWDVKNHYDFLEECGIRLNQTVTYNGKAATMVFDDIIDAFEMQDKIMMTGCTAYMQIYKDGKLLSENI